MKVWISSHVFPDFAGFHLASFHCRQTYRLSGMWILGADCDCSSVVRCKWWVLSVEESPTHTQTKVHHTPINLVADIFMSVFCLRSSAVWLTLHRCLAVSFQHSLEFLSRHNKSVINGFSCFMRHMKKNKFMLLVYLRVLVVKGHIRIYNDTT